MSKKIVLMLIAAVAFIMLRGCSITIGDDSAIIGLNKVEESQNKTINNENIKSLFISSAVGSIKITKWDKNEIYVKVTKKNNGIKDRSQLLEELKNAEIICQEDGNTLEVKSFLPKFKSNGMSIELDIYVPDRVCQFDIDGEIGDVRLNGLAGQIDVVNNIGKVDIRNCEGTINLKTVTGDVTLQDTVLKNDSELTTNTGRLLFEGSIDISSNCRMTTNVGVLDVTLPKGLSFEIDAAADVGNVECDFNVSGEVEDNKVNGTVNGGGPKLKLTSNVGGIKISKK